MADKRMREGAGRMSWDNRARADYLCLLYSLTRGSFSGTPRRVVPDR
jgi:hypothetical protein